VFCRGNREESLKLRLFEKQGKMNVDVGKEWKKVSLKWGQLDRVKDLESRCKVRRCGGTVNRRSGRRSESGWWKGKRD